MSDATNQEQSRLWRILRTTKQMCYDRGYELTEEECNISLADFKSQYVDDSGAPQRTRMAFTARPTTEMLKKYTPLPRPGKAEPQPDIGTVHVEFVAEPSIGIKHLKAFAQLLQEKNYKTGIYVTVAAPTSSALKIIDAIDENMEVFREEDLLVNISRHELVPKHTLLSPEDKKRLLERYRLKETQLPRIRQDDPMARYLGLRRGSVVKIIRKSETAGRYASYRWVI
ncbi:hypothetical protein LTR62_008247 [Meristemomyces frigidus]|uniref:DNA-directed RNA polymerases I, II, and III subunit RPABC1 n=1 Tax=Meristemomyces frigidus TaxID=1508187 RepID=A0AAN7TL22_9PEZI|nr:hypothetical protein LTR62_008247 [Meristemomyces frigidus]